MLTTTGMLEADIVSVPVFVSVLLPSDSDAVEPLPAIRFSMPPLVRLLDRLSVPVLLVGCKVIVWLD